MCGAVYLWRIRCRLLGCWLLLDRAESAGSCPPYIAKCLSCVHLPSRVSLPLRHSLLSFSNFDVVLALVIVQLSISYLPLTSFHFLSNVTSSPARNVAAPLHCLMCTKSGACSACGLGRSSHSRIVCHGLHASSVSHCAPCWQNLFGPR